MLYEVESVWRLLLNDLQYYVANTVQGSFCQDMTSSGRNILISTLLVFTEQLSTCALYTLQHDAFCRKISGGGEREMRVQASKSYAPIWQVRES